MLYCLKLQPYIPFSQGVDNRLIQHLHLFFVGIILYQMRSGVRWQHGILLALCCVVAVLRTTSWPNCAVFTFLVAIMYFATCHGLRPLTWRPLIFFGTISYPLYLIHQNLGYIVIRAGYSHGWNGNAAIAAAFAIAVLMASVLTFTVERPANAFLRQVQRKKAKARTHACRLRRRGASPVNELGLLEPTGD